MLFSEKDFRHGDFIRFTVEASAPKLSLLRVEMERVHPGMSDFVMRVSTPKYSTVSGSGTVVSIRGNRMFAKYEMLETLAKTVRSSMIERGDETYKWDGLDVSHLADMLYGPVKFFAVNTRIGRLQFTTEAL